MLEALNTIVVVEDSSEDYELTLKGLLRTGLRNPIRRCSDGDDALDYLFRRGRYSAPASAPRPVLILLDLSLPRTDGREVLREIKSDPGLKSIPVVVLTTSNDEGDIEECYRAGASSFLQKPVDIEGYFRMIQRAVDYWFEVVVLPRAGPVI